MADGDATIRLDQGGINARILAKEAKVDFRRVESASRKIQATFHSPEVKRLFVRYLNSMQLNTYLISVIARTKLPHVVIETSRGRPEGTARKAPYRGQRSDRQRGNFMQGPWHHPPGDLRYGAARDRGEGDLVLRTALPRADDEGGPADADARDAGDR